MAKAHLHEADRVRSWTPDAGFVGWFVESCFNGNLELIDHVMAPGAATDLPSDRDSTGYDRTGTQDADAFRAYLEALHEAFAGLRVSVLNTAVDGADIAVWWTADATHEGTIGRLEATGRPVKLQGTTVCTVGVGSVRTVETRWNRWAF